MSGGSWSTRTTTGNLQNSTWSHPFPIKPGAPQLDVAVYMYRYHAHHAYANVIPKSFKLQSSS